MVYNTWPTSLSLVAIYLQTLMRSFGEVGRHFHHFDWSKVRFEDMFCKCILSPCCSADQELQKPSLRIFFSFQSADIWPFETKRPVPKMTKIQVLFISSHFGHFWHRLFGFKRPYVNTLKKKKYSVKVVC